MCLTLQSDDGCDYVIVIQTNKASFVVPSFLRVLPLNVKLVTHKNECFDIGTVGWLLYESGKVNIRYV